MTHDRKAEEALEDSFRNIDEAFLLLDAVDAKLRVEPGFARFLAPNTVERIRDCVRARRRFETAYPVPNVTYPLHLGEGR